MSKGLDIELKGVDDLLRRLDDRAKNMTDIVDKEMTASILDINAQQRRETPVDTGRLRMGNMFDVSKKLDKQLFNDIEYAPYVEFGTGGLVSVPPGLEEIAIQFKGAGIRKVNLPAQPFFFRAFFEKKDKMIQNIKNAVLK